MQKLFFVVQMILQPKIFHHPLSPHPIVTLCESQYYRKARAGRKLVRSLIHLPLTTGQLWGQTRMLTVSSLKGLKTSNGEVFAAPRHLWIQCTGQTKRHKAKPQEAKIAAGAMQSPGGRTRSKGLISGTQTKSKEVNKLFYRHRFYVVSSFSRSNAAIQPFTVGRPLLGVVSIVRASSHATVKKTTWQLWFKFIQAVLVCACAGRGSIHQCRHSSALIHLPVCAGWRSLRPFVHGSRATLRGGKIRGVQHWALHLLLSVLASWCSQLTSDPQTSRWLSCVKCGG